MFLLSQLLSFTLDIIYVIIAISLTWFLIKYLRALIATEQIKQKTYKANLKKLKESSQQNQPEVIQPSSYMEAPFDDNLSNLLTNLAKQE